MGKDHPDWGGVYNDAQFYPLFDQAELAARLDSVITYDRRGSLIWWYDFADGVGDFTISQVLGSTYVLDADTFERSPFSLKLLTGTNALSQIVLKRKLPVPRSKQIGFQASIRVGANIDEVQVVLSHFTGSVRRYAAVKVDMDDLNFELIDLDEGTVVLNDDLPDLETGAYFAHVKVVADLDDHSYVRALLDDNEYDCTAYLMGSQVDTDTPHLEVWVLMTNSGENEAVCYVDSLVVTAAEPAN